MPQLHKHFNVSGNKIEMTLKQKLKQIHFSLLIFVLANFIIMLFLSTGLHVNVIFVLKVIIYLTGLVLFFMTIKPFKKQSLYFSIYLLSPLLIFISWLADGLFGAVLASIFLFIFYPPEKKFQDGDYVFYEKFQGFLGSCCTYDIVHNKFLILQTKEAELRITDEHSFERSEFRVTNNKGYLRVNMETFAGYNQPNRQVDTTLILTLE